MQTSLISISNLSIQKGDGFFVTYLLDFTRFNPDDAMEFDIDFSPWWKDNYGCVNTIWCSWTGINGCVRIISDGIYSRVSPIIDVIFQNEGTGYKLFSHCGQNVFEFICSRYSKVQFQLVKVDESLGVNLSGYNVGQMYVTFTSQKIPVAFQNVFNFENDLGIIFPTINPFVATAAQKIDVDGVPAGFGMSVDGTFVGNTISVDGVPV